MTGRFELLVVRAAHSRGTGNCLIRISEGSSQVTRVQLAISPGDNHRLFLAYARNGDVEGLVSRFEPEAIMVTPRGRLVGRAAIQAYFASAIGQMADLEFELLDVVATGDVALERLNYTMTVRTSSGAPAPLRSTSTVLLRRQGNGDWLIAIDHPGP